MLLLHDRPVGPIDDVERDEGEREDDEEGRVDRGDPLALDIKGVLWDWDRKCRVSHQLVTILKSVNILLKYVAS